MKYLHFLLLCAGLTGIELLPLSCDAQGLPGKVSKGLRTLFRGSTVAGEVSRGVARGAMSSRVESSVAKTVLAAGQAQTACQFAVFPETLSYSGRPYTRGGRGAWTPLPEPMAPLTRGIFQAHPKDQLDGNTYSGVVFEVDYQGQKEVYGVIAAHAISPDYTESALGRFFTAEIKVDGQARAVPAEIVQITAPSMLDVALVKFRPEDEKLFTPFTLAAEEPSVGAELQSLGFSKGKVAFIPNRNLLENTTVSFRTNMSFPRIDRAGLCGSAVLNDRHELVAVHTGSTRFSQYPQDDVGFATKARYLRTLVQAYHDEDGRALFPLYIGGDKVTDLNADEYVSLVQIMDRRGTVLWKRIIHSKFPYNTLMEVLEGLPDARYLSLKIQRAWWTGHFLTETDLLGSRQITYDLKKKERVAPEQEFLLF